VYARGAVLCPTVIGLQTQKKTHEQQPDYIHASNQLFPAMQLQ